MEADFNISFKMSPKEAFQREMPGFITLMSAYTSYSILSVNEIRNFLG